MYYYFEVYKNLLLKSWNNMGPEQYGTVLIVIALIGWYFMKSGLKRC
ncbi:MAG: hypothetical protein U0903_04540 [Planctomycetales bacterium]